MDMHANLTHSGLTMLSAKEAKQESPIVHTPNGDNITVILILNVYNFSVTNLDLNP